MKFSRKTKMICGVLLLSSVVGYSSFVVGEPGSTRWDKSNSTNKNVKMEWAFTKADQHPEKMLINVINSATSTLDIAIYSLTHPDIVKAIKDTRARGVSVRIITDEQQSGGKTQKEALKFLSGAGIPIKINKHSGLQHLKVTLADGKIATTGSFNYSKAASTKNDEVLMVLYDPEVARAFEEQFNRMWQDTKGFRDYAK
ncbi:phospholipase D family protein [Brevibacillus laterosporus]|uniref:phospholipase D family nuclease n=1 Tax=Brevibacillus laterosporus TaxID=1465 RepID=UPI003D19C3CA